MEKITVSEPIELIRGNQRKTVYSNVTAAPLEAEGWQRVKNLSAEEQKRLADLPPLPWNGYDDMTAADIIAKLDGLSPERRDEVVRYESATLQRVSIINKVTGNKPAKKSKEEQPPVTVETVTEAPLQTTETVQIVPGNDVPAATGQGRLGRVGSAPKGGATE